MIVVLVLLLIFAAALVITVLLDTSFELAIPLVGFAVILVLYGFGILNRLELGYWLVLASVVASCLWVSLIRAPDALASLSRAIRAPGVAIFFFYAVAAYFVTRDMQLTHYDEFSHWGRVAKATFLHDSLAPFNPVDLRFRFYTPGASLFGYFVMETGGAWREGHLFWAYQLVCGSLFTPFMAGLSWRAPTRVALVGVMSLATPQLVFRPLGLTLADPIVGYTAGFLFAVIYLFDLHDRRTSITLSLGLSVLVLLKDTAALLAAIVMIMYCVKLIAMRRARPGGTAGGRAAIGWFLLPLVSAFAARLSWSVVLRFTEATAPSSWVRRSPREILGLLDGTAPEYWYDVLREFASTLLWRPVPVAQGFFLTPAAWFILTGVLMVLIAGTISRLRNDKYEWAAPPVVWIGALAYSGVLVVLYLLLFSQEEALRVAGWERYVGTYIAAMTTFLTLCLAWLMSSSGILDNAASGQNPVWLRRRVWGLVATWLCVTALLVPPLTVAGSFVRAAAESSEKRRPYEEIARGASSAGIGAGDRVSVVVADYGTGYDGWLIRYLLLEANVWIDPHIGSDSARRDAPDWRDVSLSGWQDQLADEFDYVVLFTVDSSFREEYGSLFDNPLEIRNKSIFEVNVENGEVRLVSVN